MTKEELISFPGFYRKYLRCMEFKEMLSVSQKTEQCHSKHSLFRVVREKEGFLLVEFSKIKEIFEIVKKTLKHVIH